MAVDYSKTQAVDMTLNTLNYCLATSKRMEVNSKDKPSEAKKWAEKAKGFEQSIKEYNTKLTYLKTKPDPNNSYYTQFGIGNENVLTIAELNGYIAQISGMSAQDAQDLNDATASIDPTSFNTRRDLFEVAKDACNDWTAGKNKKAPAIAKGLVGIAAGDAVIKLGSTYLAKKGILASSTNLLGLAKTGIAQIPELIPMIGTAASTAFTACPLGVIAVGAAALIWGVPKLKKLKDSIAKKLGGNTKQFDDELNAVIAREAAAQQQP